MLCCRHCLRQYPIIITSYIRSTKYDAQRIKHCCNTHMYNERRWSLALPVRDGDPLPHCAPHLFGYDLLAFLHLWLRMGERNHTWRHSRHAATQQTPMTNVEENQSASWLLLGCSLLSCCALDWLPFAEKSRENQKEPEPGFPLGSHGFEQAGKPLLLFFYRLSSGTWVPPGHLARACRKQCICTDRRNEYHTAGMGAPILRVWGFLSVLLLRIDCLPSPMYVLWGSAEPMCDTILYIHSLYYCM